MALLDGKPIAPGPGSATAGKRARLRNLKGGLAASSVSLLVSRYRPHWSHRPYMKLKLGKSRKRRKGRRLDLMLALCVVIWLVVSLTGCIDTYESPPKPVEVYKDVRGQVTYVDYVSNEERHLELRVMKFRGDYTNLEVEYPAFELKDDQVILLVLSEKREFPRVTESSYIKVDLERYDEEDRYRVTDMEETRHPYFVQYTFLFLALLLCVGAAYRFWDIYIRKWY